MCATDVLVTGFTLLRPRRTDYQSFEPGAPYLCARLRQRSTLTDAVAAAFFGAHRILAKRNHGDRHESDLLARIRELLIFHRDNQIVVATRSDRVLSVWNCRLYRSFAGLPGNADWPAAGRPSGRHLDRSGTRNAPDTLSQATTNLPPNLQAPYRSQQNKARERTSAWIARATLRAPSGPLHGRLPSHSHTQ